MVKETIKDVLEYPIAVMPERKITKETCKKFGVRMAISEEDGKTPVVTISLTMTVRESCLDIRSAI